MPRETGRHGNDELAHSTPPPVRDGSTMLSPRAYFPAMALAALLLAALLLAAGCTTQAGSAVVARPGFAFPEQGSSTQTNLRIGDVLPAIEGTDLEGNQVVLDRSQFGDRYTLIVFWTTGCSFCERELPMQVEYARRYASVGFKVIGINSDESLATAQDAVARHAMPWLNLYDGRLGKIWEQLDVKQWPTLLLLDAGGRLVMASPELRAISVESYADGTDRQIDSLEWALRELLGPKSHQAE